MGRHSLAGDTGDDLVPVVADQPAAQDSAPVTPSSARPEPVAISAAVQAVLLAGVAVGWITVDDDTINYITTAVGAVAAVVAMFVARAKVTPISDPVLP